MTNKLETSTNSLSTYMPSTKTGWQKEAEKVGYSKTYRYMKKHLEEYGININISDDGSIILQARDMKSLRTWIKNTYEEARLTKSWRGIFRRTRS